MKVTEKIFLVIAALGLLFKIQNYPGAGPLLIISLFGLSVFYLFGLFFLLVPKQNEIISEEYEEIEEENLKIDKGSKKRKYEASHIISSIFGGFAFSVALLGILFKIQRYPGASVMLLSCFTFMTLILILSIILFSKPKTKDFGKKLLPRSVVLFVLAVFFYAVPSKNLVEIQYRNNPELKAIHLELVENPYCEKCRQRLLETESGQR